MRFTSIQKVGLATVFAVGFLTYVGTTPSFACENGARSCQAGKVMVCLGGSWSMTLETCHHEDSRDFLVLMHRYNHGPASVANPHMMLAGGGGTGGVDGRCTGDKC